MQARTVKDLNDKDLFGKKVLMRVDFNVPLDSELNITDDSRIKAALDTIKYLVSKQAKVILVSHLGRPKAQIVEKLRLNPVAKRLSELMGFEVIKLNDCIGEEVKSAVDNLINGQICLLENLRFYEGEEANDPDFAKELASLADLYVNDAFGAAHRAHASTVGVTSYLTPSVSGLLMAKELEMLGGKLENPERPFTAVIGGSKVSSKISVLKELVKKVDTIIICGAMAYTFFKAKGGNIGESLCEDEYLDTAREIIKLADDYDAALILPEDSTCFNTTGGKNIFNDYQNSDMIERHVCGSKAIDSGFQALDIGPKAQEQFATLISQSRTVVWNGPAGVFEYDSFSHGTKAIADALVDLTKKGGTTIIGGGDSVAAIEKFAIPKANFSHVSTGGGASLEFLEGKKLPGIACLDSKAIKA